jgi:hypothetical protein
MDRPVHVALGGEVDDPRDVVLLEEPSHQVPVGDVAMDEGVLGAGGQPLEVPRIARAITDLCAE